LNPLALVGRPDWRSAILAIVITLPWLWLMARGYLRRPAVWLTVAVAALLFAPSIALVQVPVQQALSAFWVAAIGVPAIQSNLVLVGLPSVFVAGAVQETVKLLIAMLGLRVLGEVRGRLNGLALGAASGAGYGGFEAFWVFNTVFATGFSWATVQLAGPAALLGFYERLVSVPFHVGAASISTYGYATGRTWRFLLAAILLHTLTDWLVVLYQAKAVGVFELEALITIASAAAIGPALWLRYRRSSSPNPAAGSAQG
jgi:RsiW-degrading membrane proteinase PrsW (M82 family)